MALDPSVVNRERRGRKPWLGGRLNPRHGFLFIILKWWQGHLGFLRIRPMDRLAIVPQRFLGKPLRIAGNFGTLRPGVTVGMKRYAFNAKPFTPLLEFRGAITGANRLQ